jgi:ABC-type amino acid transport substrate-binding protein
LYRANATPALGYDVEFAGLLFGAALGVTNLSFFVVPDFFHFYSSIRTGACDVGITAAEFDVDRTTCTSACPAVPADGYASLYAGADYADGYSTGTGPQLLAAQCCLEYSVPYFSTTGFALATLDVKEPPNVYSSLGSFQIINVGLVILVGIMVAGWCIAFAERRNNPSLDSPVEGSYWALTTITTVGYGDVVPKTLLGRAITAATMLAGLVICTVFTSTLSAALTTNSLSSTVIDSPSQLNLNKPVCVEPDYPVVDAIAIANGITTVKMQVADCLNAVLNGSVQAYLDDVPVITYAVKGLGVTNVHISPTFALNAFAAVFAAGSPLRQWTNAGILALGVDDNLRNQNNKLWDEYFKVVERPQVDSLDLVLLGAFLGLFGAAIICWAAAGTSSRFRSVLRWVSVPVKFAGSIDSRPDIIRRISMTGVPTHDDGEPCGQHLPAAGDRKARAERPL